MEIDVEIFITEINKYAEQNKLFWVSSMAKDCLEIYKNRLDDLHPIARIAVEYYLKENK